MSIWFTLLYQPLVNGLIFFYKLLGANFGWAIIVMTAMIRLALTPLTLPAMKAASKMRQLAPELEKLKKKHKKDKQALARAQMELYKKHGANPAAGCLPQILQIVILIALFQAFNQVLRADGDIVTKLNEILYPVLRLSKGSEIDLKFFYLDLSKPDFFKLPFKISLGKIVLDKFPGIFLLAAAATQFLASKLMMPQAKGQEAIAKKTEESADDMTAMMQTQMLYMMPVMTILIGFTFPSGLVLYWLTFSLFMVIQQLLAKKGLLSS